MAMSALLIPAAYKYVALAAMLVEVNFCVGKLELSTERPISAHSLKLIHISNPWITGFGGTLETGSHSFVFYKSGRLKTIQRINYFGDMPLRTWQVKASEMISRVDTNDCFRIATNWLSSMEVDIQRLQARHPLSVQQPFFFGDRAQLEDPQKSRQRVTLLPIFHVIWGDKSEPTVMVSIFGPTEELLGLYLQDQSFSNRPAELLKDTQEILSLPDQTFLRYSTADRRGLLLKHLATQGHVRDQDEIEIFSAIRKQVSTQSNPGLLMPKIPRGD